jgi:hypothetical protein
LDLRDIMADYEILARQGLKLNQSYLEMLNTYNELNLAPDILIKVQDSIFQVISSMQTDRDIIIEKLSNLNKLIKENTIGLTDKSVVEKLQSIARDCQTIGDFVQSIDLVDLRQIFINLTPQP